MKGRKLKVQEKISCGYGKQTRSCSELRLSGKWLTEAGFLGGRRVTVEVTDNCIIITPDD